MDLPSILAHHYRRHGRLAGFLEALLHEVLAELRASQLPGCYDRTHVPYEAARSLLLP